MWDYLDKMDKNLLYKYFEYLSGIRKNIVYIKKEEDIVERKCRDGYYLIWFVYRYILGCKTLEEALKYANKETLDKYKLFTTYIHNQRIYIGTNGELKFFKPEDIRIILEILYGRYNLIQQLDCFIANAGEDVKMKWNSRVNKAIRLEKQYIEAYSQMIQKHKKMSEGE